MRRNSVWKWPVLIASISLAALVVMSAFAFSTGTANAQTASNPHSSHIVPYLSRSANAHRERPHTHPGFLNTVQGSGNLAYGGGPIQQTPNTYVIFWGSGWSSDTGTSGIIQNYFKDLSGTTFENILTQYCQGVSTGATSCGSSGTHIQNVESFKGAYTDTVNPPTDTSCGGPTVEDSSLQSEVSHAISVNGWATDGSNALYLVYTSSAYYINGGTGTGCNASGGGNWCAYHNWTGSLAYGAMPYPGSGCQVSYSPSGNVNGDSEVNLTSHEEFETITDPQAGNGWVDAAGYEIGDKCAWTFPSTNNGTTTLNNSGVFEMQLEYSNASSSCVNSYGSTGGSAPTISSFNPTSGAVGTAVTVTGTNFTGATAVKFNGTAASFTVSSSTQISTSVPSGAASGPISVTNGSGTGTSSTSFSVTSGGGGGNTAQLIKNGGFESGQSPWSESSANGYQIISNNWPHTGSYSAWLCGYNNCKDQIWQTVAIPSTMTKSTLSFWVYFDTNESGSTCYDYFYARIRTSGGTTITTPLKQCNANAHGWVQYTYDVTSALGSYKGQNVQVYFLGTTDSSLVSDMFVDDVTFTVNY